MANTEQQLPLADIQEPVLNTFWPLAPGWWLLALVMLLGLAWIFRFLWLRWQKGLPLRQAKAELKLVHQKAQVAELNELLKRLIRCYQPNHHILAAPVKVWQTFLQQQMPAQSLPDLEKLLYQAQNEPSDVQAYLQFADVWLKKVSATQLERL